VLAVHGLLPCVADHNGRRVVHGAGDRLRLKSVFIEEQPCPKCGGSKYERMIHDGATFAEAEAALLHNKALTLATAMDLG